MKLGSAPLASFGHELGKEKSMSKRGQFTPYIAFIMKGFLKRDASQTELRLLPYIGYQAVNEQLLDPKKLNEEERAILQLWREAGYIKGGASGLSITREFYDFINEVLWWSYVAFREQADLTFTEKAE